jgi:hypothetical protein
VDCLAADREVAHLERGWAEVEIALLGDDDDLSRGGCVGLVLEVTESRNLAMAEESPVDRRQLLGILESIDELDSIVLSGRTLVADALTPLLDWSR